ncbi:MAG: peptidase dimerization domain-containing protein [Acidimicrobiales bacterium]
MSVTRVKGGVASNIIADSARFYVGRRVAPGESPDAIIEQLSALIVEACKPAEAEVVVSGDTAFGAFYEEPDSPLVIALTSLTGHQPETASFGTNALCYSPATAKNMVVFGPGSIDVAHQAVEWVDIDQLVQAASVYRRWFEGDGLPAT